MLFVLFAWFFNMWLFLWFESFFLLEGNRIVCFTRRISECTEPEANDAIVYFFPFCLLCTNQDYPYTSHPLLKRGT